MLIEYRIGTGYAPRADRFFDQGTGTGSSALTVGSIVDAVVSERFWTTASVAVTIAAPHDATLRVPSDTGSTWLEWWRTAPVRLVPGLELNATLAPRWQLGDYVSLGALWHFRNRGGDQTIFGRLTTTPAGDTVQLWGDLLQDLTRAREHRFGLTATYSTLAAIARGHPGVAFEVSFTHQQSVTSDVGLVPKQWQDRLMVRYYTRFLAR